MKIFKDNDNNIIVYDNGKFTICKDDCAKSLINKNCSSRANFEITVNGGKQLELNENGFLFQGVSETKSGLELKYVCNRHSIEVLVKLTYVSTSDVIVQQNTVRNIGNADVKLTRFSSAFMEDICYDNNAPFYENESIRVHICHNKWQGEGQWREYRLTDLGIYPSTTHNWEREGFKINSIGSWSTANFFPLVMIEDKKNKKTWYMETEGSHNWFIKLYSFGGYVEPTLAFEASGCDEANGGWYYDLKPGETYTTERAIYGIATGGAEEATKELIKFKRKDGISWNNNGVPMIVFNDYMDCIWGNQEPSRILPLVDKASELGCEVFCIDGGWCTNLGDWEPQDYYKDCSLAEIASIIKEKNMIPGIWFELEACQSSTEGFKLGHDCVLRRYDSVIGEERAFYNFSNNEVRKYLTEKVERFYNMGYRYIKNDYNQSIGIGCTNNYDGESPAEGSIRNAEAFYDFINELYKKFPELIIENCGSGALRSDNKTLKHFVVQSISDQELYQNNPSIVMGSMMQMPPEKVGVWAYPYPALFEGAATFEVNQDYIDKMADGKETVFNMVNAMTGTIFLSGRLDLCDDANFELVKEAIETYKNIRKYIPVSYPVFPMELIGINEKKVGSLGLLSDDKLLLSVWNIKDTDEDISIDISKYAKSSSINSVYPHRQVCELKGNIVTASLKSMSAFFLELDITK